MKKSNTVNIYSKQVFPLTFCVYQRNLFSDTGYNSPEILYSISTDRFGYALLKGLLKQKLSAVFSFFFSLPQPVHIYSLKSSQ